jgi:excisionase family DNA binding protein
MAHQNRVLKTFCTTREAAEILGVSLRTAQLWTESGLLKAWKTDGGHRRISRESIERLLVVPSRRGATKVCKPFKLAAQMMKVPQFSILVVADEDDLCRLYETSLSRWSMRPRVTVVSDDYEALIRVGLQRPDMVIVDLQRPDSNDLQKIQSIRTVPELAKTSIVVVTDHGLDDIEDLSGIPAGIPVLPKPIPFDQLRGIAEQVAVARI